MPWKDKARTLEAAKVAGARRRREAKALGLCWRCYPKVHTPAATICAECRHVLKIKRCVG